MFTSFLSNLVFPVFLFGFQVIYIIANSFSFVKKKPGTVFLLDLTRVMIVPGRRKLANLFLGLTRILFGHPP